MRDMNENIINTIKINKNQIVKKADLEIVPMDYKGKIGENVFMAYLGGTIPIIIKSRSITQSEFSRICGDA